MKVLARRSSGPHADAAQCDDFIAVGAVDHGGGDAAEAGKLAFQNIGSEPCRHAGIHGVAAGFKDFERGE